VTAPDEVLRSSSGAGFARARRASHPAKGVRIGVRAPPAVGASGTGCKAAGSPPWSRFRTSVRPMNPGDAQRPAGLHRSPPVANLWSPRLHDLPPATPALSATGARRTSHSIRGTPRITSASVDAVILSAASSARVRVRPVSRPFTGLSASLTGGRRPACRWSRPPFQMRAARVVRSSHALSFAGSRRRGQD